MITIQDQLLREAEAIARGVSSVEPHVHHLIVQDLEIGRLTRKVDLLVRTIAQVLTMPQGLSPDDVVKRITETKEAKPS